jgi:hypothetical protein
MRGLVDVLHEFQYMMSERVDNCNADVHVVLVLCNARRLQHLTEVVRLVRHTDNEFSFSWDEPVARMFGE